MKSIISIFKIGKGPSSSHTMGPYRASILFLNFLRYNNIKFSKIRVTLYGSLALTGKGHLTDGAINEVFKNYNVEIIFEKEKNLSFHPNGMTLEVFSSSEDAIKKWEVYSIDRGEIVINEINREYTKKIEIDEIDFNNKKDGEINNIKNDIQGIKKNINKDIYPHSKMNDILLYIKEKGKSFWEYVIDFEGPSILGYIKKVWDTMERSIENGIKNEGVLPGTLALQRKASSYYTKANSFSGILKKQTLIFSYALAVSEENASGGIIVTAPTCGSAGVLPAVLYFLKKEYRFNDEKIFKAILTAGLIGKLVQTNASISGAEVGCQGEIGTACSMAAAAAAQLMGGTVSQIEYAAEIGLEHHLGLTCDPLEGYVQIPCIERNAFAASRAYDAAVYAILSDGNHKISFDSIVEIMKKTGHDLPNIYKETSLGGIAAIKKI